MSQFFQALLIASSGDGDFPELYPHIHYPLVNDFNDIISGKDAQFSRDGVKVYAERGVTESEYANVVNVQTSATVKYRDVDAPAFVNGYNRFDHYGLLMEPIEGSYFYQNTGTSFNQWNMTNGYRWVQSSGGTIPAPSATTKSPVSEITAVNMSGTGSRGQKIQGRTPYRIGGGNAPTNIVYKNMISVSAPSGGSESPVGQLFVRTSDAGVSGWRFAYGANLLPRNNITLPNPGLIMSSAGNADYTYTYRSVSCVLLDEWSLIEIAADPRAKMFSIEGRGAFRMLGHSGSTPVAMFLPSFQDYMYTTQIPNATSTVVYREPDTIVTPSPESLLNRGISFKICPFLQVRANNGPSRDEVFRAASTILTVSADPEDPESEGTTEEFFISVNITRLPAVNHVSGATAETIRDVTGKSVTFEARVWSAASGTTLVSSNPVAVADLENKMTEVYVGIHRRGVILRVVPEGFPPEIPSLETINLRPPNLKFGEYAHITGMGIIRDIVWYKSEGGSF